MRQASHSSPSENPRAPIQLPGASPSPSSFLFLPLLRFAHDPRGSRRGGFGTCSGIFSSLRHSEGLPGLPGGPLETSGDLRGPPGIRIWGGGKTYHLPILVPLLHLLPCRRGSARSEGGGGGAGRRERRSRGAGGGQGPRRAPRRRRPCPRRRCPHRAAGHPSSSCLSSWCLVSGVATTR